MLWQPTKVEHLYTYIHNLQNPCQDAYGSCYYPAVRTGSSNTQFFSVFFFCWSLAPDLRFLLGQTNTRRVFRYTGKGFILSDCNIFYTPPGGGRTTAGSNAPGAFLVLFFLVVTCPRPLFGQNNTCR